MNTMEIFKKNQLINEELMNMVSHAQPSEKEKVSQHATKVLDMVTELCAELIDGNKKEEKNG